MRRGQAPFFFNYLYVGAWTVAVGLLAILTAVVPWALPFAALASFRLLGIFVWYVAMLLDSNHWLILSPGRNLIFLGLDGFTAAMVVGLWLATARTTMVAEPTWSAALSTFMLNGAPSGFEGWPAAVATVVGTLSGLLLIAAGLAVLIALVGERLELGSPDDYTGRLRNRFDRRRSRGSRSQVEWGLSPARCRRPSTTANARLRSYFAPT